MKRARSERKVRHHQWGFSHLTVIKVHFTIPFLPILLINFDYFLNDININLSYIVHFFFLLKESYYAFLSFLTY